MARLRENDIVTPTLLRRFELEAVAEDGNGQHYAVILRDDGSILAHNPGSPELAPDQLMWAGDVLRLLNRELHHDGAWVVVFTHVQPVTLEHILLAAPSHATYDRYCLIWVDQDGDAQFTMDWRQNECELLDWPDVLLAGLESTAQKAEMSWTLWHHHMREIPEVKKSQTYRKAKGERAPSEVH
ncbi:MAG: hypothetical protein IT537_03220 [Hyphomicrobiales bacterium]|nr:hypothetical protein [Hyphomicrobiales bacterium]